jgi:phosphoglycolate phosphatase
MPLSTTPAGPALRISAILFDKDGTLLDYHRSWSPINERSAAFAASGDRALEQRLLDVGGRDQATGRYRAGSLLAAGNAAEIAAAWVVAGSPHSVPALTSALDRIFEDGVAGAVPVLPLGPYFRGLKAQGYKLGIASSDSASAILATAAHFDFAGALDFYTGYDSGHGHKPGPGMVLAFAGAMGISATEIAVVGDNLHDMAMGQSAGCGLRVGVLTGTSDRAVLMTAAHIVLDSIADLPGHLASHRAQTNI